MMTDEYDSVEYGFGNVNDCRFIPMTKKVKKVPVGCVRISDPAYTYCHYFHYSNPKSQNALAAQTGGFPGYYNPETEEISEAYSDRIQMWDQKRFEDACKIIGTGCQGWCQNAQLIGDNKLKEFAQVALNLPVLPEHVRVVHWYNVSSGYSCPTVLAIYKKPIENSKKS